MVVLGAAKELALMPRLNKGVDPFEVIIPDNIELRNGFRTSSNNWARRPGYAEKWDLGVNETVVGLIPIEPGYAITETGKIFRLDGTPVQLTTALDNTGLRPTWVVHNDLIIICNGGRPIKIENLDSDYLGGNPPKAEVVARLSSYTIMAGYVDAENERTEFRRSATGNPENWSSGGAGFWSVKKDSTEILNIRVANEKLYLFKETGIEVWGLSTSAVGMVRITIIDMGLGSKHSLVGTDSGIMMFLGSDFNMQLLSGFTTKNVTSKNLKRELNKLFKVDEIYGLYFKKERLVKFFAQSEGKCFVYTPDHDIWSEDNEFAGGQFQRMNLNSYMEQDNLQFVGDWLPRGKVYEWSFEYFTDNGNMIRNQRNISGKFFEGNSFGRLNELVLRLKRGVAVFGTTPTFGYRYRFDQGQWSDDQILSLGEVGDRDPFIKERALGRGREFELEIWETEAVDYILSSASVRIQELN